MKLLKTVVLFSCILGFSESANAQSVTNIELDEALVNGEGDFFRPLGQKLQYPAEARGNGIVGLSIFTFKVNCNQEVIDLKFESELDYGIENEITIQLNTLKFNWKLCEQRDNNKLFRLEIGFGINNKYKPESAQLVVNALGDFHVVSDKRLMKKLNKSLKKNEMIKVSEYLKSLLLRFPYNQEYLKLQEELNKKS